MRIIYALENHPPTLILMVCVTPIFMHPNRYMLSNSSDNSDKNSEYSQPDMPKNPEYNLMHSVIIIGAGIGGITTAAMLAQNGFNVTVVEKHERPGGRCTRVVIDGHHFVTGPTLFVMPELYEQTFAVLGERIEDHLELRRVDPTYRIHFKDGTYLNLTSDLKTMKDQLESIEAGSFGKFLHYLDEGAKHYQLSVNHLMDRNFRNPLDFYNLRNLLIVWKVKGLIKHYDHVSNYFTDPRLKAAFTFQDMYVGLSPSNAPALFSLLQYTEFTDGVWFPVGGMYSVIEALTNIANKSGVRFLYSRVVKKIAIERRKASGVIFEDGSQMSADLVIANADLAYVYRNLLPENGGIKNLDRKHYSCSAIVYFWGLKKQYPQLDAHNLFLSGDYLGSFDCIFEEIGIPKEPSFYIHAPARVDPNLAPKNQDTLIVIVPVGHLRGDADRDWRPIIDEQRKIVLHRLKKLGMADLKDHIKFELSYSPHDWYSRYNLEKGSTHGLSHNLTQMGYLRPHNRHDKYNNLYFVGASTHPGTGLPTVLVSARLVTERILDEFDAPGHTLVSSSKAGGWKDE